MMSTDAASPLSRPLVIETAAGHVLGYYHPPAAAAAGPRAGVLLCAPAGYEGICCQRSYRELAERLAAEGFPTMRFDYHGTGDSAGDDRDPRRLEAWIASVLAALAALRSLSGSEEASLFGVRMGGTLAALAAAEDGRVQNLAVWAPCVKGKAYLREMRAFQEMSKQRLAGAPDHPPLPDGDMEAGGYLLTNETVDSLSRVNLLELRRAPARDTLLLPREDAAENLALADAFRRLGSRVTEESVPGYSDMMTDQLASKPPHKAFSTLIGWLSQRSGERQIAAEARSAASLRTVLTLRPRGETLDVVEETVRFGRNGGLLGTVGAPAAAAPHARAAVIFLSAGLIPRSGPNRLYVRFARHWAARGILSFRIDLSGIGESAGGGNLDELLFSESTIDDVADAMALLRRTRSIERFVLIGLCSGGYVAFQAGLKLDSVIGTVLLNPAALIRRAYDGSISYYLDSLFILGRWKKVFRGDVDLLRIPKGFAGRLGGMIKKMAEAPADSSRLREKGLLGMIRASGRRGIETLMICRPNDDGLLSLEKDLGRRSADINEPGLKIDIVSGADHIFSPLWSQDYLFKRVTEHVARLLR
jgi:alpha-beta hydrolase superfamily lysophospholipase